MTDPQFPSALSSARIAILGIGLIGGSLAHALQGKCDRLIGVDSDPDVAAAAERLGIFDAVSVDPAPVLGLANFLILSAPVAQIISLIERLPSLHPGATAVLDTGSTKVEIARAMQALPSRFFPVGGHPMAGKEVGGLDSAEGGLFQGAPFALVRVREADPDPIVLVCDLVEAIGSHPVFMDPVSHDRNAAAVSHLPYLIAAAIAQATPPGALALAGPGYQSVTRLAGTPPEMMLDVIRSNRAQILDALSSFRQQLDSMESLLHQEEFDALYCRLVLARSRQAELAGLGRPG